ncbi:hypothetical protein VPH35_125545 [Triticum aestivum]
MENACEDITNVVRSVKLLRIDGYCTTETMGHGDCIRSSWNVGGYEWEICIYPAMRDTDGTRANLSCRLVDLTGARVPLGGSVSWIFNRPWTFCYLVKCSPVALENISPPVRMVFSVNTKTYVVLSDKNSPLSGFLRNDSFTVECTITVLKEDLPAPATTSAKEVSGSGSSPSLQDHLAELLRSGMEADVTFLVSGKSFAAHKLILAARSPVLMAEFFGDMKETSSRCPLLYFIYTDSVLEFSLQHERVTMLAQHLLAAADRYGLDRPKQICEGKLSDGITEQHNCPQLKVKCVDFIVSTPAILDAVLATDGYKHLEASCPMVLPELLKSARSRKS